MRHNMFSRKNEWKKGGGRRRGKLKNSDAGMVTHTKEEEEEEAGDIISQKRGRGEKIHTCSTGGQRRKKQ